jgi:ribose-phosphate pyrophosphokinase
MELLVMVDALRRQDAKKITAVVPYYGYARQDRKPGFSRTPITSRLVADMLERNGNGIDKLIVVDIHSEQQVGFFNKQVINISAAPLIAADIYRNVPSERPMIVSPDTGGVARARMIAKQAGDADLAIVDKRRPKANVSEVMNIIGDVEGRDCVIVDDLIDTAGTLCKAASALKAKGALSVRAYAPHPVFSGHAFDNIMESELDEVVVTDTIPLDSRFEGSIVRQISISGLIAETILRIRNHQSISQIYTGT